MHWTTIKLSLTRHTTHEIPYNFESSKSPPFIPKYIRSAPNSTKLAFCFSVVHTFNSFIHSFSSLSATFQINLLQINNRASIGHCCHSAYVFVFPFVLHLYTHIFGAVNGSYSVTSTPIIMTNNLRI